MNRYDHYPGDYARDTRDLNLTQHGAYRMLLDAYYSTEKPIPDGAKFRVVGAFTEDEQRETQWVLDRFFELQDGHWHHERADREIEKAQPKIRAAKENGKRGGRPRKTQSVNSENPVGSVLETQQEPSSKPSGEPNRNPDGEGEGNRSKEEKRTVNERAHRLKSNPHDAHFEAPQQWPEVIEAASIIHKALGFSGKPRLGGLQDPAVKQLVEVFAAGFTLDEIRKAAPNLKQHKFVQKVPKIHAIAPSVLRDVLDGNLTSADQETPWHN